MGEVATLAPKGLGPQNPTKNWTRSVDILVQPISRKSVFKIYGPEPTNEKHDEKHAISTLKNLFIPYFFEVVAYNLVVFGSLLRDQLFRVLEFRFYFQNC